MLSIQNFRVLILFCLLVVFVIFLFLLMTIMMCNFGRVIWMSSARRKWQWDTVLFGNCTTISRRMFGQDSLMESNCSLLSIVGLLKGVYFEAYDSCNLVRRSPSIAFSVKTPFEVWLGCSAKFFIWYLFILHLLMWLMISLSKG